MAERTKLVKCVVWDLDNTLWEGTLPEGGARSLRPGLRESVLELETEIALTNIVRLLFLLHITTRQKSARVNLM